MSGCYTYKDILFGLYKEYVILQEQLNSLHKYVLLDENVFDRVRFCITNQITDDNVRMLCYLYDKKNKIEELLIRFNFIYDDDFKASYVYLVDGYFDILEYPEIIDKTKKYDFSEDIKNILYSDFGKNMRLIYSGIGYDNIPFMSVNSCGTSVYLNGLGGLDFKSEDNFLHAYSSKGRLCNDKIEWMLNMKFSKNNFPEYYQELIEGSDAFMKDVSICGDLDYCKRGKYEIVPEGKKIVLVKK